LKKINFNDGNYLDFISVDSKIPASVPTETVFPRATFPKLSAIDNRKVSLIVFSSNPIKAAISVRDSRYRYRRAPEGTLHSSDTRSPRTEDASL